MNWTKRLWYIHAMKECYRGMKPCTCCNTVNSKICDVKEVKPKRPHTVWSHIWYYVKGKARWETDQRFLGAGRSTGGIWNSFGGWWSCLWPRLWLSWFLRSSKLTELDMIKNRLTICKIDFTFKTVNRNSFFLVMNTQCCLYGGLVGLAG